MLHLSATAFGGGVAEILYTLIPLMNDVGIEAEWQVMLGREEFYNVDQAPPQRAPGQPGLAHATRSGRSSSATTSSTRRRSTGGWDVIIVHDPQPAAIRGHVPEKAKTWVWRCHIDLSTPNPDAIDHLVPFVRDYDASVWHLPQYVPAGADGA